MTNLKTLLDDLISPEDLARLQRKRKAKGADLSDLLPAKPPPPVNELLPATRVIFHVQENTCAHCETVVTLPLGLVVMHQLVRNGRRTGIMLGIPCISPNEHPNLRRERDVVRTTSMVCIACVDEAAFAAEPPHPVPRPRSPEWLGLGPCTIKHDPVGERGYEDRETRLAHKDADIRRELREEPLVPYVADPEEE